MLLRNRFRSDIKVVKVIAINKDFKVVTVNAIRSHQKHQCLESNCSHQSRQSHECHEDKTIASKHRRFLGIYRFPLLLILWTVCSYKLRKNIRVFFLFIYLIVFQNPLNKVIGNLGITHLES